MHKLISCSDFESLKARAGYCFSDTLAAPACFQGSFTDGTVGDAPNSSNHLEW